MKGLNRYLIATFLVFMICFLSCKKTEILDIKEYLNYLADPENGLVKEKTVAGVKIKVKYLPEDYLVYNIVKEMSNVEQTYKDSIAKSFQNSVTFMLNIGPAENEEFDITRVDVSNYEEFAKRIENMAFNAQDWITVCVNKKEYHPDIVRLENINALEKSRNFIVVFNSTKNTENDFRKQDMILSYDDELFDTGVSKFLFKAEDIIDLPAFKF